MHDIVRIQVAVVPSDILDLPQGTRESFYISQARSS